MIKSLKSHYEYKIILVFYYSTSKRWLCPACSCVWGPWAARRSISTPASRLPIALPPCQVAPFTELNCLCVFVCAQSKLPPVEDLFGSWGTFVHPCPLFPPHAHSCLDQSPFPVNVGASIKSVKGWAELCLLLPNARKTVKNAPIVGSNVNVCLHSL